MLKLTIETGYYTENDIKTTHVSIVYINRDNLVYLSKVQDGTKIHMINSVTITVRETPEQIMEMINA